LKNIVFILLLGFLHGAIPQNPGFPKADWERSSPTAEGISETKLNEALRYMEAESCGDGHNGLVIIKNGKIIFAGDSATRISNTYSTTKSFTSTILGFLIQEKKCKLMDYAWKYEPSLKEKYPYVRLLHFITMTSGYSAVGDSRWGENSKDWSLTPYSVDDPLFAYPGTQYAYWDEAMMMLGKILTQIAQEDISVYLNRKLFEPIGIKKYSWWSDTMTPEGLRIANGCTGLALSALDMARFGYFLLNKGYWEQKQILSPYWIKDASSVKVDRKNVKLADTDRKSLNGVGIYGYNFWINAEVEEDIYYMPDAPKDIFFTSGLKNNQIYVIPSKKMVVVRNGTDCNPPKGKDKVWNQFFKILFN
jgi:CubicO group peptidase (beta-lactamase class C family)